MKIVQINTVSNGSTGNIALSIHKQLLKEGHDSYFFFGIGKTINNRCQCFERFSFVRLHSFLSRVTGLQGYFSLLSTKKLIRKLLKIDPDIIHLHNYHGSYLHLKTFLRYIKKYNKRLLITLHDCCLFTGKCPHFVRVNCQKWKTGCFKCPQLKRYPISYFFDTTKKTFHDKKKWILECEHVRFVAVSDWIKNVASLSFIGKLPITRIYNGVDSEVFKPYTSSNAFDAMGLSHKKIILGVSFVWSINKGLDRLIEMSSLLNDNEVIVLIGISEEQQKNLPPNIIGIEKTDSAEELRRLYSSASVFVTLSMEESFGLVVVESLMCGTPCVAFDSTALSELIQDGINGYLVPIANAKFFLNYVRKAMKLKKTTLNKRDVMSRQFDKKTMVSNYISEYEKFLRE